MPFEKGQSGNPEKQFQIGNPGGGRVSGKRNRSTIARLILESNVSITAVEAEKQEAFKALLAALNIDPELNQAEVLLTIAQFLNGLKGDPKSYNALMDSGYGKPAQPIEMIEPEQKKYDYSRITAAELEELERVEARYSELLAQCEITETEIQGGE